MSDKVQLIEPSSVETILEAAGEYRGEKKEAAMALVRRELRAQEARLQEQKNKATELEILVKQTPDMARSLAAERRQESRIAMWVSLAQWGKPVCTLLGVCAICATIFGVYYIMGYWDFHIAIGQ